MAATPSKPQVEQRSNTVGIGNATPRLSWKIADAPPAWCQSAYEIERAIDGETASSGRVESQSSVLVEWPFAPLSSRQQATIRVRVWDSQRSEPSDWSESTTIETGLLDPTDWKAAPIATVDEAQPDQVIQFRRAFSSPQPVTAARLYASSLGLYEVEINGEVVGDEVLAPGWTSYNHRLRYATHDVTNLIREGANAIGITVAEGWYSGRIGFRGGIRELYGDRPAAIAQLELSYADGSREIIATDASWSCRRSGPVVTASLYDGEVYDANRHDPDWSTSGYEASGWESIEVLDSVADRLIAPSGPPVQRHETFQPQKIWAAPSGETLIDFGQNISGRLRIRVRGPQGTRIVMRHAEVLEEGELGVRPLRDAAARDEFVLSGTGEEVYEPRFTIHGFRYASIVGWPGEVSADAVEAVALYSSNAEIGTFECSHAGLNQLHHNTVWSMKGNFVDIPTDCPQRDERLGWTGDIGVFTPAAAFLADCAGFLGSWLEDLAVEQADLDTVPPYIPWVPLGIPPMGTAAWSDAAVIVPWELYERFGDPGVLARQYPSMKAWVDTQTSLASPNGLWDEGFQFGDWLDPTAPPDDPAAARTQTALVATAYRAHSLRLVARAAEALGYASDADTYSQLAETVVAAFNHEFVTPSGRLSSDAQTAYALAIRFDLLPTDEQRLHAGRRLRELVVQDDYCIGTGFVGTPFVCDALVDTGHLDDAYLLLLQTKCPSWLYPVSMGATTIWERWDSMLPDGSINPGEMTSFNHYAFGAVADFMHRRIAGLAPGAPGYRHMIVRPQPGGGLQSAAASHLTPFGIASVRWERTGDQLAVDVTVPPSATASVELPGVAPVEVTSGDHHFEASFQPVADDVTEAPVRPRFFEADQEA